MGKKKTKKDKPIGEYFIHNVVGIEIKKRIDVRLKTEGGSSKGYWLGLGDVHYSLVLLSVAKKRPFRIWTKGSQIIRIRMDLE